VITASSGARAMPTFTPVYLGGAAALATAAVAGSPRVDRDDVFVPGIEALAEGEIRVTILGSGQPWLTKAAATGSVLVEIGNAQREVMVFDLGSGSLANFSGLQVPATALKKVFSTHLHTDHISDYLTLTGSCVKAGRLDPVEVWGGSSNKPSRGIAAFVEHIQAALAWDFVGIAGNILASGAGATATEVPYGRTEVICDRNGVTITSFPVIHVLNGAIGFRVDFAGQSAVSSGETTPTMPFVEVAQGCDLLIHETVLPPKAFAEVMGLPIELAQCIVNDGHTPAAAGIVFDMVRPAMAAMWHCHVTEGDIDPVFAAVAGTYSRVVALCQDLTVFNVTPGAVGVHQATVDPMQQAILGPSDTGRKIGPRVPTPEWWKASAIDWQSKISCAERALAAYAPHAAGSRHGERRPHTRRARETRPPPRVRHDRVERRRDGHRNRPRNRRPVPCACRVRTRHHG